MSFPASPDNPVTFPASLKAVSSSTSPVNVITIPVSPVKVVSSPANPDKVVPSPASPDEVLSSSASPDKVVIPVNVVSSMASPDKSVTIPASPDKAVSSPASPDKVVLSPTSSDVVLSSSASPDKVVTIPASPDKVVPSPASSDSPDLSHTMMQSSLQPSPMMAGIPASASSADHFSSLLSFPICNKSCSSCSLLWQHINSVHISRYVFPSATFFACCNRLICSVPSCRWATHERFHKTGYRRLLKPGQCCNAPLVSASDLPFLICDQSESQSPTSPSPPSLAFSTSIPSDPLELALLSASVCSFIDPTHVESEALSVVMNYVMTCPVSTVVHIPRSVRPLLARILSTEFRNAISSVWGFMRLFLFAKLALRMPPLRQHRRRFILASVLLDRLHLWSQPDSLYNLWKALQDDLHVSRSSHCIQSSKHNISRALFWAREGRYSNAVQSLTSTGVADKNDDLAAFQELLQ